MFAVGVVVSFDVGDGFGACSVGVEEGASLKHFRFEGVHEGFGPSVVIGIGPCGPS